MIYVFLTDGFEEIEALTTVDVLRRAALSVCTVGVGEKTITGTHGIAVTADLSEADFVPQDMTALVLPGGMPGTLNLERSTVVQAAISYAAESAIPMAAICAAPSILGHAGLLRGKNATCYPGFEADLLGAKVTDAAVIKDGVIITARGAGVAIDFALEIVSLLKSREDAEEIRKAMQCL